MISQRAELEQKIENGSFCHSANLLRFLLIFFLVFARFGLPIFSGYIAPFLGFTSGTFFLIYGYFVLRDGANLKKNIKHAAIIFAIMLVVFLILATVYMQIVYQKPFAYFTWNGVFDFLVLNYWGPYMGDYIWYVQSILYALLLCLLFKKLKKFDFVFCIVLFIASFLLGDGAGLIHFNVLGYTYIPGNFLTRTLPYMLLGRIIYRHEDKLKKLPLWTYIIIIVAGFGLSVGEMLGFSALNVLVYYGHLVGFIPVSFGLMGIVIRYPHLGKNLVEHHLELYKKMFFLYNPIGESALVIFAFVVSSQAEYNRGTAFIGAAIAITVLMLAIIWEAIEKRIRKNKDTKPSEAK